MGGEHDGFGPAEPKTSSPAPQDDAWHSKDLKFARDTAEIESHEGTFAKPVGRVIRTADEGHELLEQLAAGDKSALQALGVKVRLGFKRTELEWMLVEVQDGYVIVAGGKSAATFHGKVIGHTHPSVMANGKPALLADDKGQTKGVVATFDEIEQNPNAFRAKEAGLLPSAADIEVTEGGQQVLYTRFVEGPNGGVVNPGTTPMCQGSCREPSTNVDGDSESLASRGKRSWSLQWSRRRTSTETTCVRSPASDS